MKKPARTAAELEAAIRVEMEQISDLPSDMVVAVRPDGDTWKAVIMHDGEAKDPDRFENDLAGRLICSWFQRQIACLGLGCLINSAPLPVRRDIRVIA